MARSLTPELTESELERDLLGPTLGPTPRLTLVTIVLGVIFVIGMLAAILKAAGGDRSPLSWGLFIVTFSFLFGLSGGCYAFVALLRLTHADYRRPLTRAFEAMGVFIALGLLTFPFIARLLPAPGQRTLWAYAVGNSPVPWLFIGLLTWFVILLAVLWNGLLPDLAALRDRTTGWRHGLYRRLALGWSGTYRQWSFHDYFRTGMSAATLLFAAVIQTIVFWDLGMTFAPEAASAVWMIQSAATCVFMALAFGVLILRLLRSAFNLQAYIRPSVFGVFGQFMLALTVIWFYLFFAQLNVMWYGGIPTENFYLHQRTIGPFAPLFWIEIFCITVFPFVTLIFRPFRHSMRGLTLLSPLIIVGGYLWIFLNCVPFLTVPEMHEPPQAYVPNLTEVLAAIGALGGMGCLYCLFIKLFPIVSLWDVRHERALATRVDLYGVDLPAIGKPEEVGTWSPVAVVTGSANGHRDGGGNE